MKYLLGIRTGSFEHPPFFYDTHQGALDTVEKSIEGGLYKQRADGGNIAIQLGRGTVIKVMSEQAVKEEAQEKEQIRRNPLLAVGETDAPWKLVVQLGAIQLPPLDMPSEEASDAAVQKAIESGVFRHTLQPEHDYLFVQTGPGTVYMGLPTEQYVKQRRAAIENAMREASRQLQQQQQGGPRIIMPPGSGRGN